MAREVLAYEDLRLGRTAEALKAYERIAAESDAQSALRTRAAAMARFLEGRRRRKLRQRAAAEA